MRKNIIIIIFASVLICGCHRADGQLQETVTDETTHQVDSFISPSWSGRIIPEICTVQQECRQPCHLRSLRVIYPVAIPWRQWECSMLQH